ncbi:ornithine-acyl[acyl carrier protein] N-acyltransferase [Ectopseudomonas mendocina]|jgi:putative hemolysin|uniref:L-ornithine N(alpha)-acyltransferase n=2 Tax=Ectopseudomonas mendocina TaxID=300 RepID=A0ABD7RRJ9_ECTME|nr:MULTISPECIES: L-ornithine N(alpha)-acyltransferase [Pseudomonas]MBL0950120.1 GNAT family N-acetyltransferase [Pseudomonas sp.]AEB57209.1 ornithine-acyl[acyl carrier protein] N-acyltransferase [Pseudomonas mendocina NK-01]ALN20410.1 hemolysin [Pseudomonas mendocina S5.2]KER98679.1 hemolysin [Pseudomonas mendocina]MDF2074991.1 GNAT family N-acetyltransferase [Pseudomonas mendocina]
MTQNARRLQAERLQGPAALREAQALRYRVFSAEFDAKLNGAELGLDMDDYDIHCRHIGVRDLESGQLVATTRLLDHQAAAGLGRYYSEEEFALHGLAGLEGPVLEIGRTCVDVAYRNGATIAVLWGELAEVLNEGGYSYLMGCASISMQDGGIQAHAVMQRLRERYLCTEHLRAEPKHPLPQLDLPGNVIAEMPPLLKAYMRLGAKICGEPCWDKDFQVADVFILLKRDELCPRYARHFKAAV